MRLKTVIIAICTVAHLVVGGVIVVTMYDVHERRGEEVQLVRQQADEVEVESESLQERVTVMRALRDGLAAEDPYVVELLARRRLDWHGGSHEIEPPPRADQDD